MIAGSVGLLIFLNAINQLILYAAALSATSTAGRPADLAAEGYGETAVEAAARPESAPGVSPG